MNTIFLSECVHTRTCVSCNHLCDAFSMLWCIYQMKGVWVCTYRGMFMWKCAIVLDGWIQVQLNRIRYVIFFSQSICEISFLHWLGLAFPNVFLSRNRILFLPEFGTMPYERHRCMHKQEYVLMWECAVVSDGWMQIRFNGDICVIFFLTQYGEEYSFIDWVWIFQLIYCQGIVCCFVFWFDQVKGFMYINIKRCQRILWFIILRGMRMPYQRRVYMRIYGHVIKWECVVVSDGWV